MEDFSTTFSDDSKTGGDQSGQSTKEQQDTVKFHLFLLVSPHVIHQKNLDKVSEERHIFLETNLWETCDAISGI